MYKGTWLKPVNGWDRHECKLPPTQGKKVKSNRWVCKCGKTYTLEKYNSIAQTRITYTSYTVERNYWRLEQPAELERCKLERCPCIGHAGRKK